MWTHAEEWAPTLPVKAAGPHGVSGRGAAAPATPAGARTAKVVNPRSTLCQRGISGELDNAAHLQDWMFCLSFSFIVKVYFAIP